MKSIIGLIIFAFISICIIGIYSFTKFEDEEYIYWSKDRLLTLADFKGEPPREFANSTTIALIQCSWEYNLTKKEIIGKNKMHKNESWVRKDLKTDEYILKYGIVDVEKTLSHEQLHFNISELYLRKFKKEYLRETQNLMIPPSSKIKSIFYDFRIKNKDRDRLFDKETNFSFNYKEHERWSIMIENELDELKDYSGTLEEIIELIKNRNSEKQ